METGFEAIKYSIRPHIVNWSVIAPNNKHSISSDLRRRYSTSVLRSIIFESQNENMEMNNNDEEVTTKFSYEIDDNTTTEHMNNVENDQSSVVEYMKPRRRVKNPNKVYRLKKHLSDYDIVYLQVDSTDDDISNTDRMEKLINKRADRTLSASTNQDANDGDTTLTRPFLRQHSKSDSNIDISSVIPPPTPWMKKSSSHRDITSTQMYKEIYADNLRQYGFLLAKQLGTSNQSPDQLRKSYLKNRKKAAERREREEASDDDRRRRRSDIESPLLARRKLSSHSASATDLSSSKYTSSLTDITNIGTDKENYKKPTTVIRRKKYHAPRDPLKRMSAPQLPSSSGHSIEEILRKSSLPTSPRRPTSSLSVPDLSYNAGSGIHEFNESTSDEEKPHRKLSEESRRRTREAKERHSWRMSRLSSFEGMLSQADELMKNLKTRKQSSPGLSSESLIAKCNADTAPLSLGDVAKTSGDSSQLP